MAPTDDPRFTALARAAALLESGRTDEAQQGLVALVNRDLSLRAGPEGLLCFLLAAGLARRAHSAGLEAFNLYLRDYDLPQIHLFNLLAQRVPTLALGARVAREVLVDAMRGQRELTLLEVGIGTGRATCALLRALCEAGAAPEHLTLVALEPDATSLDAACAALRETAHALSLSLRLVPVASTIEALDEPAWRRLAALPRPLYCAGSFALHHVHPALRDRVLAQLAALGPALLVLSEPDVDHATASLGERLAHAHAHFGTVFRLLEALPLDERDRLALEVCFFGRELQDILGSPEDARVERHERAAQWLARAARAGLRPVLSLERFVSPTAAPDVTLRASPGCVSVCFEGESLVSVLALEPAPGSEPAPAATASTASTALTLRRDFDASAHLLVLAAVALADGVLEPRERAFLERHAALHGLSLDAALARGGELSFLASLDTTERTRRAILRDCVLLAHADGEYHPAERERIAAIARALGMPEGAAHEAEAQAKTLSVPMLTAPPEWLARYWALATKGAP